MKHKELDDLLKGKLESYQPAYDPTSWDQLAQKLDSSISNPDSQETEFDSIIKDRLNSYQPTYHSASWDQLAGKLDSSFTDSANQTHEFDTALEQRLQNYQVAYNPNSWNSLAHKLDDTLQSQEERDTEFDTAVGDGLKNYRVAYNPMHWSLLALRLDQIFVVKRNLYLFKITEIGLMCLLLMFLFQFLPDREANPADIQFKAAPSRSPQVTPFKQPIADNSQLDSDESLDPLTEGPYPNSTISASLENERPSNEERVATSPSILADSYSIEKAWENGELDPKINQARVNDPVAAKYKLAAIAKLDFTVESPLASNLSLDSEMPEGEAPINYISGSPTFNSFALLPSIMSELTSTLDGTDQLKRIGQLKKKASLRIGMFGSTDFNRIVTPPNAYDYRYDAKTRYAVGYSGGLSLGFEKKRWEVETGFIYSAKSYTPPTILYILGSVRDGGYTGVGLKYFDLDIVQLPLNFKYFFVYKNKWRLYTVGGASLNVVNYAHYISADQDAFDFSGVNLNFAPITIPSPNSTNITPSEIIREFKDFDDGWLEGGSFWENSYFTLNAGIGIERYFSTQSSIFFQPTYQQNFNLLPGLVTNEIGPNKDRLSSMSFRLGIRVRVIN